MTKRNLVGEADMEVALVHTAPGGLLHLEAVDVGLGPLLQHPDVCGAFHGEARWYRALLAQRPQVDGHASHRAAQAQPMRREVSPGVWWRCRGGHRPEHWYAARFEQG